MSSYSSRQLLQWRERAGVADGDGGPMAGLRLEASPQDEAQARSRKEKPQPKQKTIGPIYEAVPVDAELLKQNRDELRRIERQTGAMITEKVGLRGRCTIIIQGTVAIVEKALPIVEALFDESATVPNAPTEPPASTAADWLAAGGVIYGDVPRDKLPETARPAAEVRAERPPPPGLAATGPGPPPGAPSDGVDAASPAADEDWELPDHWAGIREGGPQASATSPAQQPPWSFSGVAAAGSGKPADHRSEPALDSTEDDGGGFGQATSSGSGSGGTPGTTYPAPEGWEAYLDPNTERVYYWHTVTEEVCWDHPPAAETISHQPAEPESTDAMPSGREELRDPGSDQGEYEFASSLLPHGSHAGAVSDGIGGRAGNAHSDDGSRHHQSWPPAHDGAEDDDGWWDAATWEAAEEEQPAEAVRGRWRQTKLAPEDVPEAEEPPAPQRPAPPSVAPPPPAEAPPSPTSPASPAEPELAREAPVDTFVPPARRTFDPPPTDRPPAPQVPEPMEPPARPEPSKPLPKNVILNIEGLNLSPRVSKRMPRSDSEDKVEHVEKIAPLDVSASTQASKKAPAPRTPPPAREASDDDEGIWDVDPIASLQASAAPSKKKDGKAATKAARPPSPKAAPKLEAVVPEVAKAKSPAHGVKAKGPPPLPPSGAVSEPSPAPTVVPQAAPPAAKGPPHGVKAKGPPPLPPAEAAISVPARTEPTPSPEADDDGDDFNDSDNDKEDSAAAKRKKKQDKKKQKKKEANAKQEEQASAKPTAPANDRPQAKAKTKVAASVASTVEHKTAFQGLGDSESSEDEAPEPTAPKGKAKASTPKTRLPEKTKEKAPAASEASKNLAKSKTVSFSASSGASPAAASNATPKGVPSVAAKPPPANLAPATPQEAQAKGGPKEAKPSKAAPPSILAASAGKAKAPPRPAPPPVPTSAPPVATAWELKAASAPPRPAYEEDRRLVEQLQMETGGSVEEEWQVADEKGRGITIGGRRLDDWMRDNNEDMEDDDWTHGLTRLPEKSAPAPTSSASASAKAARSKAAAGKAKATSKPKPAAPAPKGINPLPQRAPPKAAPVMLYGGLAAASVSENAATSAKWAERPVEKIVTGSAYYEEEEDPELACYLWDRKSQRPKAGASRAAQAPPPPSGSSPPLSAARITAPPPQRQRFLLGKVVEMGFDEQSAKRALAATGWAGLEEAVAVLLG